jgi:hypothetical protein
MEAVASVSIPQAEIAMMKLSLSSLLAERGLSIQAEKTDIDYEIWP